MKFSSFFLFLLATPPPTTFSVPLPPSRFPLQNSGSHSTSVGCRALHRDDRPSIRHYLPLNPSPGGHGCTSQRLASPFPVHVASASAMTGHHTSVGAGTAAHRAAHQT